MCKNNSQSSISYIYQWEYLDDPRPERNLSFIHILSLGNSRHELRCESQPKQYTPKDKDPFNCPRNDEEWFEADKQLAHCVVPLVLSATSVEEKNKILCDGIHLYFTSKYGTKLKRRIRKSQKCKKVLKKLKSQRK